MKCVEVYKELYHQEPFALLVLLHARKGVQISLLEIFGGLAQNLLFISQIEKFR